MHTHGAAGSLAPLPERPRRAPTALDVQIDQSRVVYDVADRSVRLLDPIGAIIWSLLDGGTSLEALSDDLTEAFNAPKDQVTAELASFIRMLQSSGLLESSQPRPDPGQTGRLVLPNPPSP